MIRNATISNLLLLKSVVKELSPAEYSKEITLLNGSSIGMHVRHILEFYQCLLFARNNEMVNYDKRERNKKLESDPQYTLECMDQISHKLKTVNLELDLTLLANYSFEDHSEAPVSVKTNVTRELMYNLEHLVHHLAIIKIGLTSIKPDLKLNKNFGVASSTIRNNNLCAQ